MTQGTRDYCFWFPNEVFSLTKSLLFFNHPNSLGWLSYSPKYTNQKRQASYLLPPQMSTLLPTVASRGCHEALCVASKAVWFLHQHVQDWNPIRKCPNTRIVLLTCFTLASSMFATPAFGKGIYYRETQTLHSSGYYHNEILLLNQTYQTRGNTARLSH